MEEWQKITLLLCFFGLLREIRPSEPFISEFLTGEWRDITEVQINQEVYPVGTYSYLALLVLVFLVTDFLRFKPVIIISGLSGIGVYVIMLSTSSLAWLQVGQFVYGLFMATEVAYYTYIFAKVEPETYPKVSSYTRIAFLTGRFLSGLSAQLLTMYNILDYRELNYITLAAQVLATFWAVFLPPVKYSLYFHRSSIIIKKDGNNSEGISESESKPESSHSHHSAVYLIAHHAISAYSRKDVVIWSLLYSVSLCLFVQAQSYIQLLWMAILEENRSEARHYNGFVEAILTFLGAVGAYLTSIYRPDYLPGVVSLVQAIAVFCCVYPVNIYYSYMGYIVVGVCFHFLITQASTKVASQLTDESCFGLIFGINTLLGTALQALLTFIITSRNALNLTIYQQYYVITSGYAIVALVWGTGLLLYKTVWRGKVVFA